MLLATYDVNPNKAYKLALLEEQVQALNLAGLTGINEVSSPGGVLLRFIFKDAVPAGAQTAIDNVIAAHNPALPSGAETAAVQEAAIVTAYLSLIDDSITALPFEDMVAIMWTRRLAQFRGDAVTINTLQQAGAYWLAEWAAAGGPAPLGELLMYAFLATIQLVAMAHLIRNR